tara:strand:+ start:143 stop:247 length:105 start_codon:yes stop_codon:yes gene_type:complete
MKIVAGICIFFLTYIIGWASGYGKVLIDKKKADS